MSDTIHNNEVQKLADQLAQPWPEYIYKIEFAIDKYNFCIRCEDGKYKWWMLYTGRAGIADTLTDAALIIAQLVLGWKR
jgi:hypothetical protein